MREQRENSLDRKKKKNEGRVTLEAENQPQTKEF